MTLSIIDTFGFLFSNYYALPHLRTSKGTPTGMITGFMNFISNLGRDYKTDYILFSLDSKGKSFRNEIYSEYKANRSEPPEELLAQLPIALNLIKEMGFHSIEKELGVKIYITGKNVLLNRAADTISVGQTFSIGTTLLLVFLLISAVFKTFRAGVLIILGNAVPIITLFGLMGLLNIPLNVVTAIIATITFGIVVDDTIHLMMRYRYEHNNLFSKKRAILNSIEGEGRAVLLTTISLMIGYLTLATSQFIPVIEFALLSIFTIFIAVLSDLFVVPALLRRIEIVDKN